MSLFQIPWQYQQPQQGSQHRQDTKKHVRSYKSLKKSFSLPAAHPPDSDNILEAAPITLSRAHTTTKTCAEGHTATAITFLDSDGSVDWDKRSGTDMPRRLYAKNQSRDPKLYTATTAIVEQRSNVETDELSQLLGPKSTEPSYKILGSPVASPSQSHPSSSSTSSFLPPCPSSTKSSLLPESQGLSRSTQTLPELSSSVSSSSLTSSSSSSSLSSPSSISTVLASSPSSASPNSNQQQQLQQQHQQHKQQQQSEQSTCPLSRYLPIDQHGSQTPHVSCPCANPNKDQQRQQQHQPLVSDFTPETVLPARTRPSHSPSSSPSSPIVIHRSKSITVLTFPTPSSALNISPVECHSLSPSTASPSDAGYFTSSPSRSSTFKKRSSSFFASLSQSSSLPSTSTLPRNSSNAKKTQPYQAPDYLTAYFAETTLVPSPRTVSFARQDRFRPLTIASPSALDVFAASFSAPASPSPSPSLSSTSTITSTTTAETITTATAGTTTTATASTPVCKNHITTLDDRGNSGLIRSTFNNHRQQHSLHISLEPKSQTISTAGIKYRTRRNISTSVYQPIMIPQKSKEGFSLVTTEQPKYGPVRSTQSTISGGHWGRPSSSASSHDHYHHGQGAEPNPTARSQDPWTMVTGSGSIYDNTNFNSNHGGSSSDLPNRVSSPMTAREEQLSKLPPLQLLDRNQDTDPVLDVDVAQQIRLELPRKLRNATKWNLVYSSDQHGISLTTLYHRCKGKGPMILAIKDTEDHVFGAFVSEEFKTNLSYYGTGECFLWNVTRLATSPKSSVSPGIGVSPLPSPSPLQLSSNPATPLAGGSPSLASNGTSRQQELFQAMNDQMNVGGRSPSPLSLSPRHQSQFANSPSSSPTLRPTVSTPSTGLTGVGTRRKKKQKVVRFWKWTGRNDYIILSEPEFIGLGGGDGKFGLWIHSDLERGHSDRCETFDNEPLASACRHPFKPVAPGSEQQHNVGLGSSGAPGARSNSPKNDKEEFYCQTVEIWSMAL
ncbi:oxidation resistance protein 1 [Mortierella sp. AD011]|nr:oxidation resistance protein 1 [Mortierella sp. AD010]KAF9401228.1 oxidation resistance protein 1 [Mortierella sp. AD011]